MTGTNPSWDPPALASTTTLTQLDLELSMNLKVNFSSEEPLLIGIPNQRFHTNCFKVRQCYGLSGSPFRGCHATR